MNRLFLSCCIIILAGCTSVPSAQIILPEISEQQGRVVFFRKYIGLGASSHFYDIYTYLDDNNLGLLSAGYYHYQDIPIGKHVICAWNTSAYKYYHKEIKQEKYPSFCREVLVEKNKTLYFEIDQGRIVNMVRYYNKNDHFKADKERSLGFLIQINKSQARIELARLKRYVP